MITKRSVIVEGKVTWLIEWEYERGLRRMVRNRRLKGKGGKVVTPLVQVTFLVTPYGTLTGQDTFLISQRKVWTSREEWTRRHQKWRVGIR